MHSLKNSFYFMYTYSFIDTYSSNSLFGIESLELMIFNVTRAQKKIASRAAKERSLTPTVPISLDRSLDQGFANNGVVARGPFFRWRLDTHRIYILLLLLGKRSSAERLFNTTRSLVHPPGYFTIVGPRASGGPSLHPPFRSFR